MSTVAQIFARTLKEIGVRYVFGVPSGNMTDYIEALRLQKGISFILVGHETNAAIMAGICGKITGAPGACFATFGPGATNLSTGVGCAFLDRNPVIAFTDEMPERLRNRKVQMNIDHQALFAPITKWTTSLNFCNVNQVILKAAGISMSGMPGPVHIGVPAGTALLTADETENPVQYLRLEKEKHRQDTEESLIKAQEIFKKSEKPLIAVGLSAVKPDVKEFIIAFAEKFKIPVVLTPMAKGMFPAKHPLYAGVLFHARSDLVAETYRDADLVIGVGYDPVEFNYEEWMPRMPLLHIDSEPADIDREEYPDVVDLTGDIADLLPAVIAFPNCGKTWDYDKIEKLKQQIFSAFTSGDDDFGPVAVVQELRKILPVEGILTVDVGAHLHLVGQMWETPSPDKLLMTNGWSAMGFAIPAAIAAKLCNPGLPVAALLGDGGFLMTAGEIVTAKRLNLKIVFIVICDNSLSLIHIKQGRKKYENHYGTDLNILHSEPTNHYFGIPVIRATNLIDYKKALEKAFNSEGSTVVEVVVDGSSYDELVLKPNK